MSRARLAGIVAGALALGLCAPLATGAALAQAPSYLTPHRDMSPGDVTVTFGGKTYVNHGLVAVGRVPAATRDFNGDTLGSFSSMALDVRQWKKNADGSYSGVIQTLPDRGPNDVGSVKGTTDYANRVHIHDVTLYEGKGLVIVPTGGFLLKDQTGQPFTGKDPGDNVIVRDGIHYPSPASGEGAGKISLDSEGMAYLPDGSFYVSDEYAAGLYLFDKTGQQIGAIETVPALKPITNGVLNFNAEKPPTTGRRNNQGLEAVAVSPDGTRLITILQSATIQDSGEGKATRNNTRILVYDISKTRTPKTPIGDYVLQLPVVRENGDGGPANGTAAQSEMLALGGDRFLVLSRDSNGRGREDGRGTVFKSILLVDVSAATNLAGTPYDQDVKPVAKDGVLNADIKPAAQAELVNILNPVQLARFGQNLDTKPSTPTSLPEKLEAMALAPALDPAAPRDVFLFVGSDNDFQTAKGRVNGVDFDASLKGEGGVGDNDSLILVYRLTLPN